MKYFTNCSTLDELKKEYRRLAQLFHPDCGGDTATMQRINAEYEARFEELKRQQNTRAAEDTTGKTYATSESAADFIRIIEALLKLDGLEVELCGRWLWIGGETRKHKEALKAAGSTDTTAIRDAMGSVQVTGVTGNITFDENGDANKDMAYIKTVEDGAFKFLKTVTLS